MRDSKQDNALESTKQYRDSNNTNIDAHHNKQDSITTQDRQDSKNTNITQNTQDSKNSQDSKKIESETTQDFNNANNNADLMRESSNANLKQNMQNNQDSKNTNITQNTQDSKLDSKHNRESKTMQDSIDTKEHFNKQDSNATESKNNKDSAFNNHATNATQNIDSTSNKIPYIALLALSFAVFVFNTSEFVPIGLLSLIASDFEMSEAGVGFLMTMYAWVVALVSLPLMLLLSNIELKRLMLIVIAVFVLSHIVSALSQSYAMLMASRIGVACAHAVFWSIASPMAVRLVPKNKQSLALSFIITGSSIAIILGLPLGRVIGLGLGWRTSFLVIGIIAFLVGILLWRTFPKLPSTDSISLDSLPKLLKTPNLIAVYFITAVLVTSHFTAYSYIEPFLAQVAGFSENSITSVLVAFGAIGVVGSFIFAKYYEGHTRLFVAFALFGICISLFLLHFGAIHSYIIFCICIFWGLAITMFNLSFQSQILFLAPKATAIAMSIYSGIYNVGIGSGALIGGIISDSIGIGYVGYGGGIIAIIVCVFYIKRIVWR